MSGRKRKTAWQRGATSKHSKKYKSQSSEMEINKSFKSRAVEAITQSHYKTALFALLESKPARKALNSVVVKCIRQEMNTWMKDSNNLLSTDHSSSVSLSDIDNFNVTKTLDLLSMTSPLVSTCLNGMLGKTKRKARSQKSRNDSHIRKLMMLSISCYNRNPNRFKLLQAINSVQLWRCGCSVKMLKCFNHLGVCLGKKGTYATIDMITKSFDQDVLKWKEDFEQFMKDDSANMNTHDPDDGCLGYAEATPTAVLHDNCDASSLSSVVSQSSCNSSDEESQLSFDYDDSLGYSFVWDNVQILEEKRHHSLQNTNTFHMWAMAFAVKNRISFATLEGIPPTMSAMDIPLSTYMPSCLDYSKVKQRMEVVISRILQNHFNFLSDTHVQNHVSNAYHSVNLGVIAENPSTTTGAMRIMDHLQNYCPKLDDKVFQIPVHGDALSVERMVKAQQLRVASSTAEDRLEGLEPIPQEFHKRGIILQDTMDILYKQSSLDERGTLENLRNYFQHRGVKPTSVMNSFNHTADFIRFLAEAFVCLCFCHKKNTNSTTEKPKDLPSNATDMEKYLKSSATEIVQEIYHQMQWGDMEDLLSSDAKDPEDNDDDGFDETYYEFCICKEERVDVPMTRCSNPTCTMGLWFHLDCLGLTENDIPKGNSDWWCTPKCEDTGSSIYCWCKVVRPDVPTITCSNEECPNGEKFHLICLQITRKPRGKWWCSQQCRGGKIKEDHILNYTRALTYRCLLDLTLRDCIRENDGDMMVTMWKIHMPELFAFNHYKYCILGHRLLSGMYGWWSPRTAAEVKWNRTANITGGFGHNLELDLINEFLNTDFKENLKHSKGQYGEDVVRRCSKLVGSFSRHINDIYCSNVFNLFEGDCKHKEKCFKPDVTHFIKTYYRDKLFNNIPGREHASFKKFKYEIKVRDPGKFKGRMRRYSSNLQVYRDIQTHC